LILAPTVLALTFCASGSAALGLIRHNVLHSAFRLGALHVSAEQPIIISAPLLGFAKHYCALKISRSNDLVC
jgi:hypothetical protein